jgi:hypothetical protein
MTSPPPRRLEDRMMFIARQVFVWVSVWVSVFERDMRGGHPGRPRWVCIGLCAWP